MTVGIDSVEINRIENSIKIPSFLEKVFSLKERELFLSRRMRLETIAANFAAKEAFSKCLGVGIFGFSLSEVSVLREASGAPYLELSGRALALAEGKSFTISITHTKDTATAVVIAY